MGIQDNQFMDQMKRFTESEYDDAECTADHEQQQSRSNIMEEQKFETTANAKLYAALAKCQGEIGKVSRNADNERYKYTTIGEILDAARKPLQDNGLAIIQMPTMDVERDLVTVTTVLTHESGECVSSSLTMPVMHPVSNSGKATMNSAQSAGAVITYARRYALSGYLAISQEDNDGHSSGGQQAVRKASVKQVDFVRSLVKKTWNVEDFRKKFGVQGAEELTAAQASEAIEFMNSMTSPMGATEASVEDTY